MRGSNLQKDHNGEADHYCAEQTLVRPEGSPSVSKESLHLEGYPGNFLVNFQGSRGKYPGPFHAKAGIVKN
tara:strand:- start:14116 stop:14328 length:213 start_codon:yes stop_codon:yes gene_type:complete